MFKKTTKNLTIKRVRLNNFKKIREISIELNDITYLIGGNNSGKSSVLQAVHMAVSCARRATELQQQVIAEASLRVRPVGSFRITKPSQHHAD